MAVVLLLPLPTFLLFGWARDKMRNYDINIRLVDAAGRGDLPQVKALLQRGASINAVDRVRFGFTPLLYAIYYERREMIHYLVEAGADVNLPDRNGDTPLMRAVEHGDKALEMVEYLLAHGARLDARDKSGHTALDRAKTDPPRPKILQALRSAATPPAK